MNLISLFSEDFFFFFFFFFFKKAKRIEKKKKQSKNESLYLREHHDERDVADDDVVKVLWLEERRRRLVVVGAPAIVLAGGVGGQVEPPADGDGEKGVEERHERRVLHRLAERRARLRHKDVVAVHVVGVLVVRAVRQAPRVVRHQQNRVQHKPDGVVDRLRVAERLVAALVRQHPDASRRSALRNPVERPETYAHKKYKQKQQ